MFNRYRLSKKLLGYALWGMLLLPSLSCTKKEPCENTPASIKNPADILAALKLNHTQYYDEMEDEREFYFEYYSISSPAEHDSLATRYKQAVSAFYHADKQMIDYLLSFEKSESYNQWLFIGKSPLLSSYDLEAYMLLEPAAALILIDYYLSGKCEAINIKSKPKTLTYPAFHQFYKLNKTKPLKQLRRLYRRTF